ncbi:MAG: alkaline phosphatase [Porticoccaceae bacterium]|nr:alkaline phosphatase [Porticoccaceae bacterium]
MIGKIRIGLLSAALVAGPVGAAETHTVAHWRQQGQEALQAALAVQPNTGKAKNVILFIGDGNGITSVTATRIFDGQSRGGSGEENVLSYERFPHVALAKTYNTNLQTPDSAGTMSAIMTGVKTRAAVISLGPEAVVGQCEGSERLAQPSLLEQAEARGLATGIVTTTRITHATPAATYAKSPDRNWEDDTLVPEAMRDKCRDIARQLVEFDHGDGIEVVMGGGRRHFLPASEPDPEYPDQSGRRGDGRNLVDEWQNRYPEGVYAWNRAQFDAIDPLTADKVLALFGPSHMHYEADREEHGDEPSLAEMTALAIDRLSRQEQGYFLMVEGGRIDHAHHAGNAYRALSDGQAFAAAVQTALDRVDTDETLIIVTADHSHVLTMAGYPARGNPILGHVKSVDASGEPVSDPYQALDGLPYTTLSYANGPGHAVHDSFHEREQKGGSPGRADTSGVDPTARNYFQESLVPAHSESHGGEDVAVYAVGPWAHLIHGVQEQNYIYYVMKHALTRGD